MPAIACSYRLTEDEFLASNSRTWRYVPRTRAMYVYMVLAGCLSCGVAAWRLSDGPFDRVVAYLSVAGIGMLTYPWWRTWLLRRQFRRSPVRNQMIRWEIDAERIVIASESTRFETSWEMLTLVQRTPHGFLLQSDPSWRWLPNGAFATESDQETLAELAANHCLRYVDERGAAHTAR